MVEKKEAWVERFGLDSSWLTDLDDWRITE
jgi:hypothetical protein